MLNQQIDPQTLTRDDFEKHVDALQVAIAKHFDIQTQKKGKLRDVAAMTLFGFENGYQQALAHFHQAPEAMPQPETRRDLPGEITLNVRSDLSEYIVFGPSQYRYGGRQHGDFIHAVMDEFGEYADREETDQDSVCQHGEGVINVDFSRSQVVRQLYHDYVIHAIEVRMPSIDKYGVSPDAMPDVAHALLSDLCLIPESMEVGNVADLLHTSDTGDDGNLPILITLHSKAFVDALQAHREQIDALARKAYLKATASGTRERGERRLWSAYRAVSNLQNGETYGFRDPRIDVWEALEEIDSDAVVWLRPLVDF